MVCSDCEIVAISLSLICAMVWSDLSESESESELLSLFLGSLASNKNPFLSEGNLGVWV